MIEELRSLYNAAVKDYEDQKTARVAELMDVIRNECRAAALARRGTIEFEIQETEFTDALIDKLTMDGFTVTRATNYHPLYDMVLIGGWAI